MSFDEELRQGRAISAGSAVRRDQEVARQQVEDAAEVEFRESLRDFGHWFAPRARSRGLATTPFYAHPPEWRQGAWSKGFLGFGSKPLEADRFVQGSPVDHGWAIFTLRGARVTRPWPQKIGGRPVYDAMTGQLSAHFCLAVSGSGRICMGLATLQQSDGEPEYGVDAVYVGSQRLPAHFTRLDLAKEAGLVDKGLTLSLGLSGLSQLFGVAASTDPSSEPAWARSVLSFYVAHACQMLGEDPNEAFATESSSVSTPSTSGPSRPALEEEVKRPIEEPASRSTPTTHLSQPMPEEGVRWHIDEPRSLLE